VRLQIVHPPTRTAVAYFGAFEAPRADVIVTGQRLTTLVRGCQEL
jgi:hypothetical protein